MEARRDGLLEKLNHLERIRPFPSCDQSAVHDHSLNRKPPDRLQRFDEPNPKGPAIPEKQEHQKRIPGIHDLKLDRVAESLSQRPGQGCHRFHPRPALSERGLSSTRQEVALHPPTATAARQLFLPLSDKDHAGSSSHTHLIALRRSRFLATYNITPPSARLSFFRLGGASLPLSSEMRDNTQHALDQHELAAVMHLVLFHR
jgi:hypothetical protein